MLTFIRKFSVDLWILLAVVLYFVAAKAGLLLTFPTTGDSVLWPPPGLALALLLLLGKKIWPGIALGSLLASLLWFLHINVVLSAEIIYSSTLMAVGQTFEALLGYFLVKKFISDLRGFSKSTHVFRFLFIAIVITVVGAAFSTASMLIVQLLEDEFLLSFFMFKWLSNVVSILIITPFIISWKWKINVSISKRLVLEVFLMALFVTLLVYLFGMDSINSSITQAIPFLIIPLLIWIVFRFNIQAVMTGMVFTAFSAIYLTTSGLGPFFLESESNSLLLVQIFIAMASITSLVLYSTVKERRDAQVALENFNEKLEIKVEERTRKLEEEIEERKKMEEKTRVSNRRLRKTNEELDHFVYSVSHDLRAPIASILGLVNLAKI
ncbi:MAG: MASE1 domain-containing protein, partial [Cyclobacteriaceae bacterium]|nr:MASE1 domain-containing protein [Cyclobacteriaceae bacterium]